MDASARIKSNVTANTASRVRGHETTPAGDQRVVPGGFGVVDRTQEGHLQPVDLVAEQRQHGEQERVRQQHRGQHAERAADSELGHEVEAEEGQPAHGDRDGQPREDHGAAGRCPGFRGGVTRRQAVVQELSEASDDEERVVDPDSEPDHRDEDRRDRVDVGEPGEDEEQQECGRERADRERDRDRRRDERPEHDQEDEDRGQQPERLRGPLLDRRELRLAVVLDGDSGRLDRLADRVLDGHDCVAVLVVDDPVELRFRVGDAAVVGEGLRGERIADALEPGLVLRRLELGRPELGDRVLNRRLSLGGIEALAFRSGEHDVQHAALLRHELGLDQIRRTLRVRARDVELVAEVSPDRPDQDDEDGDDADPGSDDAPRVRGVGPGPAREGAGGKTFVGGAPLGRRAVVVARRSVVVGHYAPSWISP